ncbi:MAG: ABC transporter permease [Planctomycetes bacterium]|nr:ABC transporter permease [Planctomycetota bacterium]
MRNTLLVASREYAENARTKGFWIGILIFPVMLVGVIFVTKWLAEDATPTRHYIVVDQTGSYSDKVDSRMDLRYAAGAFKDFQGWMQKNLKEEFKSNAKVDFESIPPINMKDFDADQFLEEMMAKNKDTLDRALHPGGFDDLVEEARPQLVDEAGDFESPRRKFLRVPLPDDLSETATPKEIAEHLKPYLKGDKSLEVDGRNVDLFALVIIPSDIDKQFEPKDTVQAIADGVKALAGFEPPKVQYWSTNLADTDLPSILSSTLDREMRHSQMVARGMDPNLVAEVQKMKIQVKKLDPDKEEGKEEVSQADVLRENAPIGFVYILWISIMQVASMLLNNTIEEKSNRIIEVLLSSVTSWELMAGKLLGIAAIGITILMCWLASAGGLLLYWSSPEATMITSLLDVIFDDTLLPAFIFYFLGGYLIYAGIFLAIGSLCNTIKEAQNFMGPVMMIMIVPLLTMAFIPKDPHGTLATVLSWIPIYTPFVMMNRAAADPPAFDLYGTSILMIFSIIGVLWMCGKIFRAGILRTGQPPRFMEMLRWLRPGSDK